MRKILLFLIACISAFALQQDPSVLSGRLENGLTYYIKENKLPAKTAHFYLSVDSGSTDEAPNERGLAHFIEHMAFNGSRDFSKNELIKKLEALGVSFGADLNAQTTYDKTSYTLTIEVNENNLKDVFKVYNNWMDGVSFDPNELEKERGVIMEEDRQRNTPGYRLFQQQAKQLFENSIYLGKAPIGDMDVVKSVDAGRIKEFYHKLYQPRFMKFVAVGDFDKKEIENLIKQNLSSAKNTNSYAHPDKSIPFKNGLNIYNYDSNETGLNSIRIAYIDKYLARVDEASARKILVNSYIANLVSLLYEQKTAAENSLLRAGFARPTLQQAQTMYGFETKIIGDDFDGALSDMLGVIKGVGKYGFNEDDFNDVKKTFIKSIKTKFAQSKTKKSQTYMNEIVSAIESGSAVLSEEDSKDLSLKLLNEITLDEVNAEFRRILALPDKRVSVFSAKGYKLDKVKFIAYEDNATAYSGHMKEQKIASDLIDDSIAPKKILSKKYDEKHQIYTYLLANNASVILKPLKTRKDAVSFAAVSKGGTSNLAEPKLGGFATQLSNESGAGEFNNYQIAKILSDKHISYQKNIDALMQGFYGSSTPQDLKSLFQAINLEFNSPRTDEKILEQIKTRTMDDLAKRQNLPDYKFSTEFVKFFYNDNPRMKPLEKSDIDALRLDSLKKIVDDKFTNAASYVFIFVGDFETQNMEPLLQKYIATLPSKPFVENFTDDGVRSIDGRHKFTRNYQISQRSDVSINIMNKNAPYSKQNAIKARALSAVFKMALREQVREDNGETYGFSLSIGLSKAPYEHSSANISFTCSPQNVDKILSEIKQIQNEIKKIGAISPRHLENFKKSAILSMEKRYDQPDFWLRDIIFNQIYGEELFDLNEQKNIVNSITNDDIKAAAKIYLDDKNEVISVNSPK
ncbi:MAG: insulinase family protein [Campylobacter sp.]|nr:insulinase family protein [Campylobacter sp.]